MGGEVKQIEIKNRTSKQFLQRSDQPQKFRIKLVKDWQKKHYKNIDIYYIWYITIKETMFVKVFTV